MSDPIDRLVSRLAEVARSEIDAIASERLYGAEWTDMQLRALVGVQQLRLAAAARALEAAQSSPPIQMVQQVCLCCDGSGQVDQGPVNGRCAMCRGTGVRELALPVPKPGEREARAAGGSEAEIQAWEAAVEQALKRLLAHAGSHYRKQPHDLLAEGATLMRSLAADRDRWKKAAGVHERERRRAATAFQQRLKALGVS